MDLSLGELRELVMDREAWRPAIRKESDTTEGTECIRTYIYNYNPGFLVKPKGLTISSMVKSTGSESARRHVLSRV